jgi:uncharacterized protein (TIGR00730 family)
VSNPSERLEPPVLGGTATAPTANKRRPYRTGDASLDAAIESLVASAGVSPDDDLVTEMIVSAVRMAREDADRGELKLVNAALKELRYSFQVFEPYASVRKVSMFGSARIAEGSAEYEVARALGRRMAERGWMIITGAGPGIMQAGVEGAGIENSFGVSIFLPFEPTPAFDPSDPKLVNFRYFFTRKLTFMKESHGFVLLPGGYGTMDEAFELLCLQQTGRTPLSPVVLLDPPGSTFWEGWQAFIEKEMVGRGLVSPHDLSLVRVAKTVDEACDELCGFYTVFHSARYVGRRLVLRLQSEVPDELLARLNEEFVDILVEGTIERVEASEPELRDGDVVDLPRLALRFDRAHFARLRVLIDVLNGRG